MGNNNHGPRTARNLLISFSGPEWNDSFVVGVKTTKTEHYEQQTNIQCRNSRLLTNVANQCGPDDRSLGLAQNTTVLYDESAESSSQEDGYAHGRDYHPLVLYGR